jgi:hypothetical protein
MNKEIWLWVKGVTIATLFYGCGKGIIYLLPTLPGMPDTTFFVAFAVGGVCAICNNALLYSEKETK